MRQKSRRTFLADVSKFVVGRNRSESPAVLVMTVRNRQIVFETVARHRLPLERRHRHYRTNDHRQRIYVLPSKQLLLKR